MDTIIIATKNKGKVKEFRNFFDKFGIQVKSLLDINQQCDIKETGTSFAENALIKAHTVCQEIKQPVLADDSGLEVDILNNEPGIYSARYAGVHGNDLLNIQKLLKELEDIPLRKRTAHFVCTLALVQPNGKELVIRGTCEGLILDEMRGNKGFGYDPVFYIPSLEKTFAELTRDEKSKISHRGMALKKLERLLKHDEDYINQ